MKYRSIKKLAKKFLNDKKPVFGTYKEECEGYVDGAPGIDKVWAIMPWKVTKEIHRQAEKLGWDGCHWNDPLLLYEDNSRLESWEEANQGIQKRKVDK